VGKLLRKIFMALCTLRIDTTLFIQKVGKKIRKLIYRGYMGDRETDGRIN
jgi:hypothetical protein